MRVVASDASQRWAIRCQIAPALAMEEIQTGLAGGLAFEFNKQRIVLVARKISGYDTLNWDLE